MPDRPRFIHRRRFLGVAARGALLASAWPAAAAHPRSRSTPAAGQETHDVTRFGATRDGRTLCTAAFQKAIDACAGSGGGTVLVPPGRYLSGALFLRSGVRLHLAAGAVLLASQRPEDFPPIKGRDEGIERTIHSSLLTGIDLVDVGITGEGKIDGQGESWWKLHDVIWKMRLDAKLPREADNPAGAPLKWPRPRTVNLIRCRDVVLDGVSFRDGPFYDVQIVYCEDVRIERLTLRRVTGTGTGMTGTGTGIAIDSSKRVHIHGCEIAQLGNGIGIKSGYNEDGRRVGISCEDVLVAGCHLTGCGDGVALGSETAGNIRNVLVTGCIIDNGKNGVSVRGPRGRGGIVENFRACDLVFDDISGIAVYVSQFFDSVRMGFVKGGSARNDLEIARSRKVPVDAGTPTLRNLVFSGLTMGKVGQVALFEGLPERYARGLVLENVVAAEAAAGVCCTLAAEVKIDNLSVGALDTALVDVREVERLEIHRVSSSRPRDGAPVVWLDGVAGALVHGCNLSGAPAGYEWLRQEQCHDVTLTANHVSQATALATAPARR
jgi:polygalacturonase